MLKKILATALAAAMILGLASVAFAASFSDTADSPRETAIKRLAGLGLLNGYPDGTFRPENPITRAEFAKVIVYAIGLKDAAEMLGGVPVGFSDVPANHWASGFISIAASQEIVKGYPDGTFKPEANVTYAEAITMIMRALGYDPILKSGTWPTSYLTKASTLGVSKGISFNASAFATRANVAALIANSLTIGRLVESGYIGDNIQYEVDPDNTLLTLMGAEKAEGWLVDSPELFDNDGDTITVELTADFGEDEEGDPVVFDLADDAEFTGLIGHKVSAWLNNDGEVFFIEDKSGAETVADIYSDRHTVELDNEDEYDLNDYGTARVFKNYMDAGTVGAGITLNDDDVVSVVFDGDDIASIIVLDYTFKVVDSVSTAYDRITFKPSGSLRLADYDVTWSGAAEELGDLEENDVVQYIVNSDEEKAVVIVTRNAVTGEYTRLSPSSTNATVTVDGTKYTEAVDYDVPDLLGEEVTILLNMFGKVQYMFAAEDKPAEEYIGIVVAKGTDLGAWGTTAYVKIFNSAGETLELKCTDGVYDGGWLVTLDAGDIVEYELDDGDLDAVTPLRDLSDHDSFTADEDDNLLTGVATFGTVKVSSSTVVFDMSDFVQETSGVWDIRAGADEEDLEVASVSSLLANETVTGLVYAEGGKATVVAVFDGIADTETFYGWASGKYEEEDIEIVAILSEGVTTEYVLEGEADSDLDAFSKNTVVKFTLRGDEVIEIESLDPLAIPEMEDVDGDGAADDPVSEWRVVDIDGDVIEVARFYTDDYSDQDKVGDKVTGSTMFLLVDGDTLFYDYTGSITSIDLTDVAVDSVVELHIVDADDDGVIDADEQILAAIVVVD